MRANLVIVMVMVMAVIVMVMMMPGLRRTLPVFTANDGTTIRAKLAVHVRRALFGFFQPLQEGCNHPWMGIEIGCDECLHIGMVLLISSDRGLHLFDQSTSE